MRRRVSLILPVVFWLGVCAAATAAVPVWTRFEVELASGKDYGNPPLEVEVMAEFSAPDGTKTTVPAFWDYGRSWKVRFSPNQIGKWSYRTTSSDAGNSGLQGVQGEFECVPYEGDNPLYARGAVGIAPEGRYFAHVDRTPCFWLGDTAWNGPLLADEREWEVYLRDRREKHFNVVQFVMMQWRSAAGDENGRPAFIIRNGKLEIDPIFFQRMDQRMDAINAHGLLAAPIMFWTHRSHPALNPGMFLTEEQKIVMGRYLIARYGAHQVAWILGGDGLYDGEHAAMWRRVGRELFGAGKPGMPRPVTVHAGYWCAEEFESEEWWTFNGYQSGHVGEQGLKRITQGEPTTFWKRDAKRPSLNLEPSYEAHRDRAPGATGVFSALDVRRAAYYSLLSAPPAGLTYGAHGIWGWHARPEEPMTHPGTGVGPAWHDAMRLPGSLHLKYLVELFRGLDWTKLRPAQQLLVEQPGETDVYRWVAVARTQAGDTLLAYAPPGSSVKLKAAELKEIGSARWYSPRTAELVDGSIGQGPVLTFDPPSNQDWVLVLRRERP